MATTTTPLNQVSTADVSVASPNLERKPDLGPVGLTAAALQATPGAAPISTQEGVGTEGEVEVWEGRYALRNFVGRFVLAVCATVAWLALATWRTGDDRGGLRLVTIMLGIVLAIGWLALLQRMLVARFSHLYGLTNRRLFISTGLFRRRRDQMELLRVQDVFTRQTFGQRLLDVGTVVVVSSEPQFPQVSLPGVASPKAAMDRIWHFARAERDKRSVKVDAI